MEKLAHVLHQTTPTECFLLFLIRIRAVLNPQIKIVAWIPCQHIWWHFIGKLLCIRQIRICAAFMKGALIHFAPLRQEFQLPPLITCVPSRCPLVEIDDSAKCIACVDFTAVQDLGMVEQNVTGFYLCWHCVFALEIGFTPVNNFLRLFNPPKVAFGDYPDTSVINGGVIYVYVNVEYRMVFADCVAIAVPSHGRSVFRQFKNKGFIARYKIGTDDPMEQIPDERMSEQSHGEFVGVGVQIGQIVRYPFWSAVTPFVCRSACQNLVNESLAFALDNGKFILLDDAVSG